MSRWTKDQQNAIELRDHSIIVSASAGSGKTSVLVERILTQLMDEKNPVPADKIIVVTFTNDAAAEMKQRLADSLAEQMKINPDNSWLNKQYLLLQSAHISTIHSFCFDLIRENIDKFDISNGFRIVESGEFNVLLNRNLDDTMEEFYTEHFDDIKYLIGFFGHKNDSTLREQILSLYEYKQSMPFGEKMFDKILEMYSSSSNDYINNLLKIFITSVRENLNTQISYVDLYLAGIKEYISPDDKDNSLIKIINRERKYFENLLNCLDNIKSINDLHFLSDNYDSNAIFDRAYLPKGMTDDENDFYQKKIRKDYKEAYKAFKNKYIFTAEFFNDDVMVHHKVFSILFKMIENFTEKVNAEKIEKNIVTFSDAEQFTLELLAKFDENNNIVKTPLAKSLSEYYKVIMIDEYQDSNNIQDLIFKMLSKDGTFERNGQNMFVVGDMKQSIYSFRNANPEIFLKTLKTSQKYKDDPSENNPKEDFENSAIILNQNFRSTEGVIDFINYVFENIMCEQVGGISYTKDQALLHGLNDDAEIDATTEMIFISKNEITESDSDDEITAEAKYVAEKIHDMIGKEYVNDKGNRRLCRAGDFCILVRNNASVLPFSKKLEEYGIKTFTEDIKGYLQSREISILINILKIISNPLQDIELASILMSSIYGMTAEEFSEMRLNNPNGYVYNALINTVLKTDDNNKEKSYYKKSMDFYNDYQKLRKYTAEASLEELVHYIYDDTNFMTIIQLQNDGEQKQANLRLLLQYVKSYESNSNGGLTGFIRYIDKLSKTNDGLNPASLSAGLDDVVKLKTIHKSKGLEFPFVFISKTSKKFNKTDFNQQMLLNYEYGAALKIINPKTYSKYNTIPYMALRYIGNNELISEEMRILYVALTRARQKLFITLEYDKAILNKIKLFNLLIFKNNGKLTPDIIKMADSLQDWLIMAALLSADCKEAFHDIGITPENAKNTFPKIKAYTYASQKNDIVENITEEIVPAKDDEFIREIRQKCSFSYPDEAKTKKASKVTVTEISHKNKEISLNIPEFNKSKKGATGAEKGTATHAFMEFADYSNAEFNVNSEIERLYSLRKLTEKQKDILNISDIEQFFKSDLYLNHIKNHRIHREKQFLIKISDISKNIKKLECESLIEFVSGYNDTEGMLQGVADCIVEDDDGIIIIDYKTDSGKNEKEYKDAYSNQIKLYSAAFEKIYNKPVKLTVLYSFNLNKEIICD